MDIAQIILAVFLAGAACVHAADTTLLIQIEGDGKYKVWHTEGATRIDDDEVQALEASAKPEGGDTLQTAAGPARAYTTRDAVVIVFAQAKSDNTLLVDRDGCGAVKAWHGEGSTRLTEDELTELVLSALPGGGKRIRVGDGYAKAYTTRLGVMAVIWKPMHRP